MVNLRADIKKVEKLSLPTTNLQTKPVTTYNSEILFTKPVFPGRFSAEQNATHPKRKYYPEH
jgi:hypothetical protein